jgi:hypothetical protein
MPKVAGILERIEAHKARIAQGKLFHWLSDETIDGRRRLNFTPSMLFYLMGFKDVLGALLRSPASSDHDNAINAYCGEDAEHWRWFLQDLNKLGFEITTWGATISAWCNEVWSPATEVNRKTIFRLVNHATAERHPIYSLALIWVFEATGVIFIGHTRKAAINLGMDEELSYFGRVHYEEEFEHSVVAHDYANVEISDELNDRICAMVDELFGDYDALFDCWFDHRDKYAYAHELKRRAT